MPLEVVPVPLPGEVRPGDRLARLLADAAEQAGTPLRAGDCLVVTQKAVSKAEGRLVRLEAGPGARRRLAEAEARRVLRRRGDLLITETHHGWICANSGVDVSNVPDGWAVLLPVDADRSARRIHDELAAARGVRVAVVITDTVGRPWRRGLVDVAIGVCGLRALLDLRGRRDHLGRPLEVTEVALADEVAAAAELVMGKYRRCPAAVVRGLDPTWFGDGRAADLVRPPGEDLFR